MQWGFPGGSEGKESSCQCRRPWFDPWIRKIPWRWEWQPTPVFLPGEFHGQRSLAGYSPWGHKESDTTEGLTHTHTHTHTPAAAAPRFPRSLCSRSAFVRSPAERFSSGVLCGMPAGAVARTRSGLWAPSSSWTYTAVRVERREETGDGFHFTFRMEGSL